MSDVSAINPPTPSTAPASAAAATSSVADSLGADVFLQLLVAQLKYQDPTSPAEGTEFLAQTAQFTMVEKLTQIAEQAEASAIVNRNLGAATMVGQEITWLHDDGSVGHGLVETARLGSAGPVLVVDGVEVPFDAVSTVSDPTPPIAPPPVPESSQPTDGSIATTAMDGTPDTEPVPGS